MKNKTIAVCILVLGAAALFMACPEKDKGKELLNAAKDLGKTLEKNVAPALDDFGDAAKKTADGIKKTADSKEAKKAVNALGDAAKDAIDKVSN